MRKLHTEQHLRISGFLQRQSLHILHHGNIKGDRFQSGGNQFYPISLCKLVTQRQYGVALLVTGFHLRDHLPLADVAGILRVLTGIAVVEAGGTPFFFAAL